MEERKYWKYKKVNRTFLKEYVWDYSRGYKCVRRIHLSRHAHIKTRQSIAARLFNDGLHVRNLSIVFENVKRTCLTCQVTKKKKNVSNRENFFVIQQPRHMITGDIFFLPKSSDGYVGCLTLCDAFTKKGAVAKLKMKTASYISAVLKVALERHFPQSEEFKFQLWYSDPGSEFQALEVQRVLREFGFEIILSNAKNPVGLIERFNQTVKNQIKAFILDTNNAANWPAQVEVVMASYNQERIHSIIGSTPQSAEDLLFMDLSEMEPAVADNIRVQRSRMLGLLRENMRDRGSKDAARRAKTRVTSGFEVGDVVFVNTKGLGPQKTVNGMPIRSVPKGTELTLPGFCKKAVVHKHASNGKVWLRWGSSGGVYKSERPGSVSKFMWHPSRLHNYILGNDFLLRSENILEDGEEFVGSEMSREDSNSQWKFETSTFHPRNNIKKSGPQRPGIRAITLEPIIQRKQIRESAVNTRSAIGTIPLNSRVAKPSPQKHKYPLPPLLETLEAEQHTSNEYSSNVLDGDEILDGISESFAPTHAPTLPNPPNHDNIITAVPGYIAEYCQLREINLTLPLNLTQYWRLQDDSPNVRYWRTVSPQRYWIHHGGSKIGPEQYKILRNYRWHDDEIHNSSTWIKNSMNSDIHFFGTFASPTLQKRDERGDIDGIARILSQRGEKTELTFTFHHPSHWSCLDVYGFGPGYNPSSELQDSMFSNRHMAQTSDLRGTLARYRCRQLGLRSRRNEVLVCDRGDLGQQGDASACGRFAEGSRICRVLDRTTDEVQHAHARLIDVVLWEDFKKRADDPFHELPKTTGLKRTGRGENEEEDTEAPLKKRKV